MSVGETGFKLLIAKVSSTVVLFIGLAYFARELTPMIMGSFFLFRALHDALGLVANFGITRSVEKRVSEDEHRSSTVTTGLLMKLVLVVIVALPILLLQDLINGYVGAEISHLLVVSLFVGEFSWYFLHVLRGELRVEETAAIEASRLVGWIVVSVILVEYGFGIKGIIYGYIFGMVILGIWSFVKLQTGFGVPSYERVESIFSFSKYDFLSHAGSYVYNWMDIALIGFFLTQNQVGIYEYAWQLTLPVILVTETATMTLFPQISRWHKTKSIDELTQTVSMAINALTFISIPAVVGVLILGESILSILFGPDYVAGSVVLVILMAGQVAASVQRLLGTTISGIDKPRYSAWSMIATILTNVTLNVLLIPRFGIEGAAVATVISVALNLYLHWFFVNKHLTLDVPISYTLKTLAVSGAMAVPIVLIDHYFRINGLLDLGGVVMFAVIVYVTISYFVPTTRSSVIAPAIRVIKQTVAS